MSVKADSAGEHVRRITGLPAGTATSEWGAWVQAGSHASAFLNFFARMNTFGSQPLIGVDTEETGSDTIDGFVYDGTFDGVLIKSGGFLGWIWICVQHTTGTADYTFKYRLEGDTSITTAGTVTAAGGEVNGDLLTLFDFGFGDPVNATICCFFANAGLSSDAALFALSDDLEFDGSALNTKLRLATAATAGTNDGTSGAWTATGALADGADEPTVGGGGGSDTPMTISATATQSPTRAQGAGFLQTITTTAAQTLARVRGVGRSLATTQTQESGSAPVTTGIGQSLSATQTQAVSRARQVGSSRAQTQTQTPSMARDVGRTTAQTQVQTGLYASGFGYLRELSATAVQAASRVVGAQLPRSVAQVQIANRIRLVGITITSAQVQATARLRDIGRTVPVTAVQVPVRLWAFVRVFAATQVQQLSLARSVGKTAALAQTQTLVVARVLSKTLAGVSVQTNVIVKSIARTVSQTSTQSPSNTYEQSGAGDLFVTLSVTAVQVTTVARALGRNIQGATAQQLSRVRSISRQVLAAQSQSPTEAHGASTLVTIAGAAAQVATLLKTVGVDRAVLVLQVPSRSREVSRVIQRVATQTLARARNVVRTFSAGSGQSPQTSQGDITDINLDTTAVQAPSLLMEIFSAPRRRLGKVVSKISFISKRGSLTSGSRKL